MKIKKELLQQFARETALSGEHSLKEVKLNFKKEGLEMTCVTEGNHIYINAVMPSSSFEDYAELGEIAILNYTELQKVIATMNEDISIKREGNFLVLRGGRKVDIPLANPDLIKTINKAPKFEYPNTITINKKFFEDISNNLSFSLNKSDAIVIEFEGEGDTLKATYGTKYKFEDAINVKIAEKFKAKYGLSLLNAVANITGDLSVSIKQGAENQGFPATIEKASDMYTLKIIIAPRV